MNSQTLSNIGKPQFLVFIIVLAMLVISNTDASADTLNIGKNLYTYGDIIRISGQVDNPQQGKFVGLVITTPGQSDIVAIDQFLPASDGKFSRSYKAEGPKWNMAGTYTIEIAYNGKSTIKAFEFALDTETVQPPVSDPVPKPQDPQTPEPEEQPPSETLSSLKLIVPGFPDVRNAPQHYIDRYYNEPEYRKWFHSIFPDNSIEEVVSYPQTNVTSFPSNENSPKYYIDRYNNEPEYREWFDSLFPNKTIYEVLDYPQSLFPSVPFWIKNNAKWWSDGLISDAEFLNGIEYMISNGIIVLDVIPEQSSTATGVPDWIRNTAKWWSDGLIEERDFVNGLKFLLENGIISVSN